MSDAERLNLPGMCEALLDERQLKALLHDLQSCARIERITIKANRGRVHDDDECVSLERAFELIRARQVRGVQLSYWFENTHWIDTLMPVADGVRLVRVEHSAASPETDGDRSAVSG